MNDRLGSNDVDKLDGNIRYYGANPNNYIDIGDRDSEGNIIFWRIIGLFKDVEVTDEEGNVIRTEDLVKIIKADSLSSGDINSFSWDYKSDGTHSNDWKTSTLNIMLNNAYYNSRTTNYYNNSTTPITLNFESTGLSNTVHSKIERVNWNFVGESAKVYADEMYRYETTRTNKWSGKIALMNPSDYGYAVDLSSCQSVLYSYHASKCTSTNWLIYLTKSQWTISSRSVLGYVFFIKSSGEITSYDENTRYYVRPTLYLKSDVSVVDEKETSEGLKYLVIE